MKEEGDIAKLSEALGLSVDVRLAKSMDNYLCLRKLEDVMSGRAPEVIEDVYYELPQFVFDHGTMQNFTHYGDRKEFPLLNDEEWSKVNWDYFKIASLVILVIVAVKLFHVNIIVKQQI